MNVIQQIKNNVFAYNKNMTDLFFDTLDYMGQLKNCHPADRQTLARKLHKMNLINNWEFAEFDHKW